MTPLPPANAVEVLASATAERMAAHGSGVVVLPGPVEGAEALRAEWGDRGVVVVSTSASDDVVAALTGALAS